MMRLMVVFAHRLEAAYKRETIERRRQLKGSLQHFDLPTVLQTLGRAQGTLSILNGLGNSVAEIEIQFGVLQYARHGHLRGAEAFNQLFQARAEGEFVFREGVRLPAADRGPLIARPVDASLIAAMALVDEMRALVDRFPEPNRIYVPRHDEMLWLEGDSTVAANDLWSYLHRGMPFARALAELPYSHARLYIILAKLVDSEQVSPAD